MFNKAAYEALTQLQIVTLVVEQRVMVSIGRSVVTLIQTEIWDAFPWNSSLTFMVPTGVIILILVTDWLHEALCFDSLLTNDILQAQVYFVLVVATKFHHINMLSEDENIGRLICIDIILDGW